MNAVAETLEANRRLIEGKIRRAAERASRPADSVRLVAVTKTHPVDMIQAALDIGLRVIGENRVQEAREKLPLLRGDFEAHLIGHLQGNKAGAAVELFSWIESVDSADLAHRLSRLGVERGRTLRVLWEVNTSGEPAKFGFEADVLRECAAELMLLPGLETVGLMTLGPVPEAGRDPRPCFRSLRLLRDELEGRLEVRFPELSMGMSGDYETAVEEGSTLVRIGSALFGPRR